MTYPGWALNGQNLSISHVDKYYIKSMNSKKIRFNILFYGDLENIKNIFELSNLKITYKSNQCVLNYETI